MTRVSAIVSTYNSERFFRGRLDDLLAQTLYAQGQLEIVVVNSGSKQGERYIARSYLSCITYIESLHESIYAAFNRGIAISKGELICNANCDDRLRPDALEVMAAALDERPDIGLVYADATVVASENARFGEPYEVSDKAPYFGKLAWPEFTPAALLDGYFGGPNPMWRKALHTAFGLFDTSYQLAGDYEWALRLVANGVKFWHLPQTLTLFYDGGANIANGDLAGMEARRALLKWRTYIR